MCPKIRVEKVLGNGDFVCINGERMKVGILGGRGNAVLRGRKITGVFAVVQWRRRGRPLEKIAYNTVARTIPEAKREMVPWMKKLQFPEWRESSLLIGIVRHRERLA